MGIDLIEYEFPNTQPFRIGKARRRNEDIDEQIAIAPEAGIPSWGRIPRTMSIEARVRPPTVMIRLFGVSMARLRSTINLIGHPAAKLG